MLENVAVGVAPSILAAQPLQRALIFYQTLFSSLIWLMVMIMIFHKSLNEVVCGVMEGIGRPNLANYFPTLRLIDPQGIRRKMNVYLDKLFDIFYGIISERLKYSKASSTSKDVLDALLNLTKENDFEWSCNDIKHLLRVGNISSLTMFV